jgi:hypothetical protein
MKTAIVMFRRILLEIHNIKFNQNPFYARFPKIAKSDY